MLPSSARDAIPLVHVQRLPGPEGLWAAGARGAVSGLDLDVTRLHVTHQVAADLVLLAALAAKVQLGQGIPRDQLQDPRVQLLI